MHAEVDLEGGKFQNGEIKGFRAAAAGFLPTAAGFSPEKVIF
jgi:hypothetical protein